MIKTSKMINKSSKIIRDQWKVSCFAFILCLWISEFQVSQGSQNLNLSGSVRQEEKFAEVQNDEKITVKSLDISFDNEKNGTRPWILKCCKLNYGYTFENKSLCVKTEDEFLPDFEDWPDYSEKAKSLPVETRYEYFIGDPCLDGKYILDPIAYPDDEYSVYSNGTLLHLDELYKKEEFCLETLNGTIRAFVCFGVKKPDYEVNFMFIIYAVGLLISIPFLLITALIHLCVDRLRDLRGKSLSCHVLCLATGYLVLAIVQLASDQLNEALCIAAGFIIQFFFVASFFWLNVICYDTWHSINNEFPYNQLTNSSSDKITFCCYSLYGWYGPILLSIITLIMDLEPAIPESYLKPNFGLRSCWFYSDGAALPYFYGPVAFVICVNVIFFVMSAKKIYSQKKVEEKHRNNNRNSLEKIPETDNSVQMYIKTLKECIYLFCIMGINWVAEITSWAVGGSQKIWLITDIFNALQGIMIFYLFVMKPKRIRNEVKKRICLTWKKINKCGLCRRHSLTNLKYKEPCYENENDKFLNQSNTTAV